MEEKGKKFLLLRTDFWVSVGFWAVLTFASFKVIGVLFFEVLGISKRFNLLIAVVGFLLFIIYIVLPIVLNYLALNQVWQRYDLQTYADRLVFSVCVHFGFQLCFVLYNGIVKGTFGYPLGITLYFIAILFIPKMIKDKKSLKTKHKKTK